MQDVGTELRGLGMWAATAGASEHEQHYDSDLLSNLFQSLECFKAIQEGPRTGAAGGTGGLAVPAAAGCGAPSGDSPAGGAGSQGQSLLQRELCPSLHKGTSSPREVLQFDLSPPSGIISSEASFDSLQAPQYSYLFEQQPHRAPLGPFLPLLHHQEQPGAGPQLQHKLQLLLRQQQQEQGGGSGYPTRSSSVVSDRSGSSGSTLAATAGPTEPIFPAGREMRPEHVLPSPQLMCHPAPPAPASPYDFGGTMGSASMAYGMAPPLHPMHLAQASMDMAGAQLYPLLQPTECLVGLGGAYQSYCTQIISEELNCVAQEALTRLKLLQLHDPPVVTHVIGKRYFCSLKEVSKVAGRARALIVAPDVRPSSTAHIRPVRMLMSVLQTAEAHGVPVVFALSRRGIGQVFGRDKSMSIVAVMQTDGIESEYLAMLSHAAQGQSQYRSHVLGGHGLYTSRY